MRRRASLRTASKVLCRSSDVSTLPRVEQRGRVDDGGERVANLVRHASRQLTGGRQPLGFAQPLAQSCLLGHILDQLEQEHLAVRLADR